MKRIIYLIGASLFILMASSVFADDIKYAVIIGTYESQQNADRQLKRLEEHFSTNETMVRLQEENGFDYLSEEVNNFYVVAIKPIAGKEAVDQVYIEASPFSHDLYVSLSQNYMAIHYRSPLIVEPAPVVAKAEPEAEPAAPVAKSVVPPATAETAQLEPAAQAEAVASASEPVKAEPEPAPAKPAAPLMPKPLPKAESADDLMLYGGTGVVALLLLLIMLLRRKKTAAAEEKAAAETEPEIELTIVEPVQEAAEQSVEESVEPKPVTQAPEEHAEVLSETVEEVVEPEAPPHAPEEIEPMPLPSEEEAVSEEIAEPVVPGVEEVVEETIEEEMLEAEEAPGAEAPAEQVVEAAKSPRKKRDYKRGMEPISKENFKIFEGVRVLVAEDNMINQKVISGLLADTGIEITMANDGKEAVDTLERDQDFAIVLMDAHMPVMDGFEATQAIRANPLFEKIPVIALSGDTAADDIRKMLEAGMEDHLEKPLHMDALYEVMYNYCDFEMEAEETEEEEIRLLPDTPELHAEKGLDISMGDEELYREILGEFAQMYGNSDEQLHEFIVKDQYAEAGALLLDIRGIAANIGADPLAETAEQLREAFLNQDEKAYTELYNDYATHLKAVLRDIEKV